MFALVVSVKNDRLKPVGYEALRERYPLNPLPHSSVSYVAFKGDRKTVVEPDLTTEVYPSRYDPGDIGAPLRISTRKKPSPRSKSNTLNLAPNGRLVS